MATKKNAVPEMPVNEDAELEKESAKLEEMAGAHDQPDPQMLAMQSEIARLKAENEKLRKNSVYSSSPMGGATDLERVKRACEQAIQDGVDPWTVKISVLAPRIGKGEDSFWLCVNGNSVQIPANDRYYEMALPFAECLVEEVASRNRAADFADSIQVYDPIENPHPVEKI